MVLRLFGLDILARFPDDDGDLQFVIQSLGVGRVRDDIFMSVIVIGIREIKDGKLVPILRDLLSAVAVGGFDVGFKSVEIAQGRGLNWRVKSNFLKGQ